MAPAALLKETDRPTHSVHAHRVNRAKWAHVAQLLRDVLTEDDSFQPWEVEAIVSSMVEIAQEPGTMTAERLAAKLHAKQFPKQMALALSQAIVNSYG